MNLNGLAFLLKEPTPPAFALLEQGSISYGHGIQYNCRFAAWLLQAPITDFSAQIFDAEGRDFTEQVESLTKKTIMQSLCSLKAGGNEILPIKPETVLTAGKMIKRSVSSRLAVDVGETDAPYLLCHSDLATSQSSTMVSGSERWMFEVTLESFLGNARVGWISSFCRMSDLDRVGDTSDSYGFDGVFVWNGRYSKSYGSGLIPGDIIGIGIDMELAEICFWVNGVPLGAAFKGVDNS
jgi:hypothetical protein